MSMAWYFSAFDGNAWGKFAKGMTPTQKQRVLKVLTDPREYDWDEDEIDNIKAVAEDAAEHGIDYARQRDEEAKLVLDEMICIAFRDKALAKAIGATRVSPDCLNVRAVGVLKQLSGDRPVKVFPILNKGRRIGESEPSLCQYAVFTQDEVRTLRGELFAIVDEPDGEWPHPSWPEAIRAEMSAVFDRTLTDPALLLYGRCT